MHFRGKKTATKTNKIGGKQKRKKMLQDKEKVKKKLFYVRIKTYYIVETKVEGYKLNNLQKSKNTRKKKSPRKTKT